MLFIRSHFAPRAPPAASPQIKANFWPIRTRAPRRQLTLRAALALRAGASLDHWRRPVPADAPPGQGGGRSRCKNSLVYRGRCAPARPLRPPARSCARRASAGGRSALSGAHWRRDWARSGNSAAAAGPHSSAIRFGVARRAARAAPLPRSAKPTHLSPLSDASTRVVLPAECQPSWACTAATRHPHPLNLLQRPPPLDHQVPISANLGNVAPHHSALRSSMCSRNVMCG